MKNHPSQEIIEAMRKDPGNWKGLFYFNKKDPGLIVPKLYPSMGWTLNFASPYSFITLAGLILIIVLSAYYLK